MLGHRTTTILFGIFVLLGLTLGSLHAQQLDSYRTNIDLNQLKELLKQDSPYAGIYVEGREANFTSKLLEGDQLNVAGIDELTYRSRNYFLSKGFSYNESENEIYVSTSSGSRAVKSLNFDISVSGDTRSINRVNLDLVGGPDTHKIEWSYYIDGNNNPNNIVIDYQVGGGKLRSQLEAQGFAVGPDGKIYLNGKLVVDSNGNPMTLAQLQSQFDNGINLANVNVIQINPSLNPDGATQQQVQVDVPQNNVNYNSGNYGFRQEGGFYIVTAPNGQEFRYAVPGGSTGVYGPGQVQFPGGNSTQVQYGPGSSNVPFNVNANFNQTFGQFRYFVITDPRLLPLIEVDDKKVREQTKKSSYTLNGFEYVRSEVSIKSNILGQKHGWFSKKEKIILRKQDGKYYLPNQGELEAIRRSLANHEDEDLKEYFIRESNNKEGYDKVREQAMKYSPEELAQMNFTQATIAEWRTNAPGAITYSQTTIPGYRPSPDADGMAIVTIDGGGSSATAPGLDMDSLREYLLTNGWTDADIAKLQYVNGQVIFNGAAPNQGQVQILRNGILAQGVPSLQIKIVGQSSVPENRQPSSSNIQSGDGFIIVDGKRYEWGPNRSKSSAESATITPGNSEIPTASLTSYVEATIRHIDDGEVVSVFTYKSEPGSREHTAELFKRVAKEFKNNDSSPKDPINLRLSEAKEKN